MSNSLRDQLLKAGLATQAQIEKAEQDKHIKLHKKPNERPLERVRRDPPHASKVDNKAKTKSTKTSSQPPVADDLAQFYNAREKLEREEKAKQERLQREAAEHKKRLRQEINTLLQGQLLNEVDADIRYNFVVGDTIKYLYVTATQQAQLAQGQLAITFMDGKRCLITLELAQQIKALAPDKLIIIANPDETTSLDGLLDDIPDAVIDTDSAPIQS